MRDFSKTANVSKGTSPAAYTTNDSQNIQRGIVFLFYFIYIPLTCLTTITVRKTPAKSSWKCYRPRFFYIRCFISETRYYGSFYADASSLYRPPGKRKRIAIQRNGTLNTGEFKKKFSEIEWTRDDQICGCGMRMDKDKRPCPALFTGTSRNFQPTMPCNRAEKIIDTVDD